MEDILKKVCNRLFWGTIDFHSRKKNTMEVNGAPELLCFPHSSEYLSLCSEQRHSYRFGTTWGWVNDRIFIFGWTIHLITSIIYLFIFNWVNQLFCHVVQPNCREKINILKTVTKFFKITDHLTVLNVLKYHVVCVTPLNEIILYLWINNSWD